MITARRNCLQTEDGNSRHSQLFPVFCQIIKTDPMKNRLPQQFNYDSRWRQAASPLRTVELWFDGGLFKLAAASVFWILLELGSERQKLKTEMLKAETNLSLVPPASACAGTSTPAATK